MKITIIKCDICETETKFEDKDPNFIKFESKSIKIKLDKSWIIFESPYGDDEDDGYYEVCAGCFQSISREIHKCLDQFIIDSIAQR